MSLPDNKKTEFLSAYFNSGGRRNFIPVIKDFFQVRLTEVFFLIFQGYIIVFTKMSPAEM